MSEESSPANGTAPKANGADSAIVTAISSMSDLLAFSLASLKSSMTDAIGEMKETIDQLVIEEGPTDAHEADVGDLTQTPTVTERAKQSDKNQQSGSAEHIVDKSQKSVVSTEQSINNLLNKSSESQQGACADIDVLSGIASDLKLDQKQGPPVNEQIAKIVHGLMREKLSDEVLTETQNRYNRPENCDCLTTTKVNHLIWDKLKPDTRSNDIKLQRVQSNLVKGLIPVVSIVQRLVDARDKIPKDALDVAGLIRVATDAIALIGAANFEINMRRRDNIKPELNEDYKHLCYSSVPFTESLFGNDSDLSKQLKDLAEATKVSKKLSRSNAKLEANKNQGYRSFKDGKSKRFGYKYRGQGNNSTKQLNWKRPAPPIQQEQRRGEEAKQIGPKDPSKEIPVSDTGSYCQAGRLQQFVPAWKEISDDPVILDWVEHCHIEFIDNVPPVQKGGYKTIKFNDSESAIIDAEIKKLLKKGVIVESAHSEGEFVSTIFLRLKKNGIDYRMILNLKELNNYVVYRHFKMDSLKSVTDLMTQGCFMASVDIRDAYYTVPIAMEHQTYLKFAWRDKLYQYTCLPNGLASAPRIFTKLLKPVFTILRKKGHLSSSYIDDCYLQGESYDECYDNVQDTVLLLQELGFPIHDEKSVLIPSQILTFLGFVLNSVTMTVQLTANRKEKLKNSCLKLVSKDQCTIQNLAEVIGLIVSSLPGVEYGPLHYRTLERDKTYALREHKGNFGASMTLSQSSKAELNWWIVNVDTSSQLISHGEPELLIQTDASSHGWGGVRGDQKTGGRWTQEEASHHINYLDFEGLMW